MNQPASVSPAKPAVTRIRRFVTIQSPVRSLSPSGQSLDLGAVAAEAAQ